MTAKDNNARLVGDYLTWLEDNDHPWATLKTYRSTLTQLCRYMGTNDLRRAELHLLDGFVNRPLDRAYRGKPKGGPRSPASRKGDAAVLKSFYRWCEERERVERNDARFLRVRAPNDHKPKAVDDGVWKQFWLSDLHPEVRVAVGLGFFCGLRRQEIVGLRRSQVNVAERRLAAFVRKGGGDDTLPYGSCVAMYERHMPALVGEAQELFHAPLEALTGRSGGSEFVLPWGERNWLYVGRGAGDANNPNQLNRRIAYALRDAGMNPDEFTPHALRHSFVTNLLRMGVPIQTVSRLANHSSIDVTMRYVKLAADPLAEFLG